MLYVNGPLLSPAFPFRDGYPADDTASSTGSYGRKQIWGRMIEDCGYCRSTAPRAESISLTHPVMARSKIGQTVLFLKMNFMPLKLHSHVDRELLEWLIRDLEAISVGWTFVDDALQP